MKDLIEDQITRLRTYSNGGTGSSVFVLIDDVRIAMQEIAQQAKEEERERIEEIIKGYRFEDYEAATNILRKL